MSTVVAVIGAGNGGTAIAAHIASKGGAVRLCDLFPEFLEGIQKAGGVELTSPEGTQKVKLQIVSSDLKEVLSDAQLIMVVTPAFTHKMIAEACAECLENGQIIVLNPGRTAGALEFLQTVRAKGCNKDIVVAETQTLIYSCRKTGPAAVHIYGVKSSVDISALPSNCISRVLNALEPYYTQFSPVNSTLNTSLANIGSMFHPTPILMNIGRIENDPRGYRYYWDGITPAVAQVIEKLDAERLAVGKAYGVKLLSAKEWLACSYRTKGDTLYERIQNNKAYGDIMAPKTIQARYMTEDIPNGLVPIAALGHAAGVATPNIDAVVTLACSIYGKNFRMEGRSLRSLDLEDLSRNQIVEYFRTGIKQKIEVAK